jgi:hypothetical protein
MKNIVNISLFKDCKTSKPTLDIPIHAFYENVIDGEYKNEVEIIRSTSDLGKIKTLKSRMPAVTISGSFKTRKVEGLKEHSGRICIDIDGKQNPSITDWNDLRTTLGSWKEVEFSALSASGKGVFVVILLSHPDNHLEHFYALERAFKNQGIVIDAICKDLPRLRFMSYDADAIYNPNVTPFHILYKEPKPTYQTTNHSFHAKDNLDGTIDRIIKGRIDITDSYINWFAIGCALANEYGEVGRTHFHRLSQLNSAYKPSECDRQFDKCLKHKSGYTKGSLFWIAKNHGITLNKN